MEEPEPVINEDSVEEFVDGDGAGRTRACQRDVVPPRMTSYLVTRWPMLPAAALIATAADETRGADARTYAEGVAELSEVTAAAGVTDSLQGEELLDASTQVSEVSVRMALLSMERRVRRTGDRPYGRRVGTDRP